MKPLTKRAEVQVLFHTRLPVSASTARAFCLLALALFCAASRSEAAPPADKVSCRPELKSERREELARELRRITGWSGLAFDESGVLKLGAQTPTGGSEIARRLLTEAVSGKNVMLVEDASASRDVVFCRVIKGRWKKGAENDPPVYIIQIDFADFTHLTGDRAALEAFNAGWGFLHEVSHVVNDAEDPAASGEAGECEGLINRMRRECGLAERADYFFTFVPGTATSAFMTKLVRIAFEQERARDRKRKRYWIVWDASLVGGLDERSLVAAR